jgi:hypothetical protein
MKGITVVTRRVTVKLKLRASFILDIWLLYRQMKYVIHSTSRERYFSLLFVRRETGSLSNFILNGPLYQPVLIY